VISCVTNLPVFFHIILGVQVFIVAITSHISDSPVYARLTKRITHFSPALPTSLNLISALVVLHKQAHRAKLRETLLHSYCENFKKDFRALIQLRQVSLLVAAYNGIYLYRKDQQTKKAALSIL
jgi:hypothetical protein